MAMATVLIFSGTNLLTQKTHQLQIECPYGPLQKLWRIVMDHFFGPGNPGVLFKRPTNVYTFHDTMMASVEFRAEQVTKPGAHSSSTN
jgi:hypothetical protein